MKKRTEAPVNNTNPRPTAERLAQIRANEARQRGFVDDPVEAWGHLKDERDLWSEIDAQAADLAALREAARDALDHFSDGHQARQLDALRALLGEP